MHPIFSPVLRDVMKNAIPGPKFIFTCKTTGAGETFSLPLEASGGYDFQVDWGDNRTDKITAHDDAAVTHTYANAGTYTVKISGAISGWTFNNGGDKTKIYDIKSWGPLLTGNNGSIFYGCSNLTISAIDKLNTEAVTIGLASMFRGTTFTTVPSINNWDFSGITSLGSMFRDNASYNQDISALYTGLVTTMVSTFRNATAFEQDISSWDITSLTGAADMFTNVTLTTAHYSALLIGWEAQAENPNVTFHGGNSKYSAGAAATARAALVANGWTITDGGQE